MKKLKKILSILTILLLLLATWEYYTTTSSYITKNHWKVYDYSGVVFSDVFTFNDKSVLRNYTIFNNKQPLAIIVKVVFRPLIENFIVIEDIKTKAQATYIGK